MAIDTEQKRYSIMTLARIPIPPVIIGTGSIDRQAVSWGYSGIAWGSAVVRVYVPFTLIFDALSAKELVYSAYSSKELIFDGYSAKELTFTG